jgi:hypothetical protein
MEEISSKEEISRKLKNKRTKFEFTIEQVSNETKVRSYVISALEENKMDLLPAPYINSFIKTLTDFYQKIEEDSEYLNRVKSATVSNKSVIDANLKINSDSAKKVINPTNRPQFKNTNKPQNINKIQNDKSVETKKITSVVPSSQININKIESMREDLVANTPVKKVPEKFHSDENIDGFTVKEKISDDTNSTATVKEFTTNESTVNIANKEDIQDKNHSNDNSKKENLIKENTDLTKENTEKLIKEKKSTNPFISKVKQKNFLKPKIYFANTLNISRRDFFIYSFVVLFFAGMIFFVFFYEEDMFNDFMDKTNSYIADTNDSENLTVLDTKKSELFNYFEKIDSIVLKAKCVDTAWVKIEIDGKKTDEFLMFPGMENRWSAWEKIVLNTSNVGGIVFSKNDTTLPKFGASGSLVKNIIITHEGIANVTPLTTSNNPVSANELNPTEAKINPSGSGLAKSDTLKQTAKKRKSDTVKPSPIIDFSPTSPTKPTILE